MADPGFPIGGVDPLGGRGPPTWVLFGKNVCENKRIWSHGGGACIHFKLQLKLRLHVVLLFAVHM